MAFAVIIALYAAIGAMSAAGTVYLSQKSLPARFEPAFFGVFLIPIAAFYLAFTAYFGDDAAWSLETGAVAAFAVLGIAGIKFPLTLSAAYGLHGAWDVLHEIQAHVAMNVFGGNESTQIPLAYGIFCASYDWCIAAYFLTRHEHWHAAWAPAARAEREE